MRKTTTDATIQSERELMRDIQLALAEVKGLRLWRINVGQGWGGEVTDTTKPGEKGKTVVVRNAQPIRSFVPVGFSDLAGFIVLDGGDQIMVFIEVKTAIGRISKEQANFLKVMTGIGCRAGVARSVEDALRIVRGEI